MSIKWQVYLEDETKQREIDIDGRGMRGTAPCKNPTTTFINAETRSDRLMAVNAHAIHNTKKESPEKNRKRITSSSV
jgi:hypothetical protein